jgi:hypothetical protein
MHTVYITRIVTDWDMRSVHNLPPGQRGLYGSQVILCLNSRMTIARLVDSAAGIHTYYAPDREQFDLRAIENIATDAIGIKLKRYVHLRRVA